MRKRRKKTEAAAGEMPEDASGRGKFALHVARARVPTQRITLNLDRDPEEDKAEVEGRVVDERVVGYSAVARGVGGGAEACSRAAQGVEGGTGTPKQ